LNQEAKRRQKEEEELKRKKERDSKRAEFDKLQNAGKPNFVISKRTGSTGEEVSII
jgi:troponin T